jgi:hypothetical protein
VKKLKNSKADLESIGITGKVMEKWINDTLSDA